MPPRMKQIPRGSQGPIGGRHRSQTSSSPSANISTPYNENISSTWSESGYLETPLEFDDQLIELDEGLIEFVSQQNHASEPSRKRQKIDTASSPPSKDPELEPIIVDQGSVWIRCVGSKLSELDLPIERSDIGPYVHLTLSWGSTAHLDIIDETRQQVLHVMVPLTKGTEDFHLALLVHQESRKWARLQGRLWTEFGIRLCQENGLDYIDLFFKIKWNTTTSPYNVMQATTKTPALLKVM